MRAVQLLRGSPRRKAVAGFAAAITVVTGFFVVQGLAGATVITAPPTHLLAAGPTNPDNGFPTWYKDSNNLNVGLCLDLNNPFCVLAGAGVPDETQPVSFPDNFPDESFYQLAQLDDRPAGRHHARCWTTTSRARSPTAARSPATRSPSAGSGSGSPRRPPVTT